MMLSAYIHQLRIVSMIFLGIDPGTVRVGYGVVKKDNGLSAVSYGLVGDKDKEPSERLAHIGEEIKKLIKKYNPDVVGIEKIYFSKNKKTAISVAEARGVIVFVVESMGIPMLEFTPSDIKRAVAGDGSCDKESLRRVVSITLGEKNIDGPDDISDALAIAIRASFEQIK